VSTRRQAQNPPRHPPPAEGQGPGLSAEAVRGIADLWADILLADLERNPPLVEGADPDYDPAA